MNLNYFGLSLCCFQRREEWLEMAERMRALLGWLWGCVCKEQEELYELSTIIHS